MPIKIKLQNVANIKTYKTNFLMAESALGMCLVANILSKIIWTTPFLSVT
jgi:hypothetical protein